MKSSMTDLRKGLHTVFAAVILSFLGCLAVYAQTPADWEN